MYSSVLFCADCIFISFLISTFLKWCSVVQPLTILKYLISTNFSLFMYLALIVQDSLPYGKDVCATALSNFNCVSYHGLVFKVILKVPHIVSYLLRLLLKSLSSVHVISLHTPEFLNGT